LGEKKKEKMAIVEGKKQHGLRKVAARCSSGQVENGGGGGLGEERKVMEKRFRFWGK